MKGELEKPDCLSAYWTVDKGNFWNSVVDMIGGRRLYGKRSMTKHWVFEDA